MTEQNIQKNILKYLEGIGAYVFKTIQCNKAGVADIIGCLDSKFFAIEVKTPKGKTSPLQEYHLAKANKAGGIAFVARSVEDVKQILG